MRNTFEQELTKIVEKSKYLNDTNFTGGAAFNPVTDKTIAKIQFTNTSTSSNYDAIKVTIINRYEGTVDVQTFKFDDIIGRVTMRSGDKITPHLWKDSGEIEWYGWQPKAENYCDIAIAIDLYIEMFMD